MSLALLIIASMVGTGVFTTSGLLLSLLGSADRVLWVWALGGVVALCGALSYAEISSALPESGGEPTILTHGVHPFAGFLAGMVSITAGFAAPVAACAIGFAKYVQVGIGSSVPELAWALSVIAIATLAQLAKADVAARIQDGSTVLKLLVIGAVLVFGIAEVDPMVLFHSDELPVRPSFGVASLIVYYAYTGWNAAAYVAGEARDPHRSIPRALVLGTGAVTLLYLVLNAIVLAAAPLTELSGVIEVAAVAARALYGENAARMLAAGLALGLVSTIGALLISGAQVASALGQHHPRLALLSARRAGGAPIAGLIIQAVLAGLLCATATYDLLLSAVGFLLSLASAATVAVGLRERIRPRLATGAATWRAPLFPLPQLVFLAMTLWAAVDALLSSPELAMFGTVFVVISALGYGVLGRERSGSPKM